MVRTRDRVSPVYWAMVKNWESLPTCVVAGPNPHRAWLYVHNPTPTVLRLHSEVIVFLLNALRNVAHGSIDECAVWRLPKDTRLSYPECLVVRDGDLAWLQVMAATPTAVHLAPRIVDFLNEVLARLPVIHKRGAGPQSWHQPGPAFAVDTQPPRSGEK